MMPKVNPLLEVDAWVREHWDKPQKAAALNAELRKRSMAAFKTGSGRDRRLAIAILRTVKDEPTDEFFLGALAARHTESPIEAALIGLGMAWPGDLQALALMTLGLDEPADPDERKAWWHDVVEPLLAKPN